MVGCVDNSSEGGWELEGVSKIRRPRVPSGSVGSFADDVAVTDPSSSAGGSPREGNWTGALDDWGAGVLFLRRDALAGKTPSNDCHGRGG